MVVLKRAIETYEPAEEHYSIRDVYTDSDGNLVVRLENRDGRTSIVLDQEALAHVKRGMLDNQRLRPEAWYPNGKA